MYIPILGLLGVLLLPSTAFSLCATVAACQTEIGDSDDSFRSELEAIGAAIRRDLQSATAESRVTSLNCSTSGDSCSVDGDCPGGETCDELNPLSSKTLAELQAIRQGQWDYTP